MRHRQEFFLSYQSYMPVEFQAIITYTKNCENNVVTKVINIQSMFLIKLR